MAMRKKAYLESALIRAESDLMEARLKAGWGDGFVGYLLGQVVTLEIVLNAGIDWHTVCETVKERTDRAVAEHRKQHPVHGQEAFCSTCGNEIVFSSYTKSWDHKYEGIDPPGYMDENNHWHICGGPIKPRYKD